MPLIVQKDWWTLGQIRNNPNHIFVFGDNEQREGKGGQAKLLRDFPNKIGIRTKRKPRESEDAYWSDENYKDNCRMVREDFLEVQKALDSDKVVIFPEDGFGTGKAELATRAPKTLAYIKLCTDWIIMRYGPLAQRESI